MPFRFSKTTLYPILSVFFINTSYFNQKKVRWLWFLVPFAAMVLVAINNGKKMGLSGDFAVFWYAGINFFGGNELYSGIGGANRFIYPPFAALLFQVFAISSLKHSATWFGFFNFGLFVASIWLLKYIFSHFITQKRHLYLALGLACLCSFRFFWYHQLYVQMNELVYVLCLLGLFFYLKKNENAAVLVFVVATFIKILPIFFLIWLASKGNFKTILKIALVAIACVLMPFFWRGTTQGTADLWAYYHTFLEPFKNGRVEPEFCNHSLASALYKWFLPTQNEPLGYSYQLFEGNLKTTQLIYKISFATLMTLFLGTLIYRRLTQKRTIYWEFVLIFALTHLLSGITWEYHFVSMQLVYVPFFYALISSAKAKNAFNTLVVFLVVAMGLVGSDTVGSRYYHYIGGFGALTLMLLLLFFISLYKCLKSNS